MSFTQLLLQAPPDLSHHFITSTRADLANSANLHTSKSLQFCCSLPRSCSVITWPLTAFPTCLACQSRKIHGHYPETKRTNLIPCWNPIYTIQYLQWYGRTITCLLYNTHYFFTAVFHIHGLGIHHAISCNKISIQSCSVFKGIT